MIDIKLQDGEIVMGFEDVDLVSGNDCLIQDIRNKLLTYFGTLFYDKKYGSGLLKYIQAEKNDITLRQIKQDIRITLKEDERIDPNSIKVSFDTSSEKLVIMIDFRIIEGENLEIGLSL